MSPSSNVTTERALTISLSITLPITVVVCTFLILRHRHLGRSTHAHLLQYPRGLGSQVRDHTTLSQRLTGWYDSYIWERKLHHARLAEVRYPNEEAEARLARELELGGAVDVERALEFAKMANAASPPNEQAADDDAGPEAIVFLEVGGTDEEKKWTALHADQLGSDEEKAYRIANRLPTFPLKVANPHRLGLDVSDTDTESQASCESRESVVSVQSVQSVLPVKGSAMIHPKPPRPALLPSLGSLRAFDFGRGFGGVTPKRDRSEPSFFSLPERNPTREDNKRQSDPPSTTPTVPSLTFSAASASAATSANSSDQKLSKASPSPQVRFDLPDLLPKLPYRSPLSLKLEEQDKLDLSCIPTPTRASLQVPQVELDKTESLPPLPQDIELALDSDFADGLAAIADQEFFSRQGRGRWSGTGGPHALGEGMHRMTVEEGRCMKYALEEHRQQESGEQITRGRFIEDFDA